MTKDGIKQQVITSMENIGIFIFDADENFRIDDYIVDSIMFVSFIIELEQMFEIEISDTYLNIQKLETFDDVCEMVYLCLEENDENNDM